MSNQSSWFCNKSANIAISCSHLLTGFQSMNWFQQTNISGFNQLRNIWPANHWPTHIKDILHILYNQVKGQQRHWMSAAHGKDAAMLIRTYRLLLHAPHLLVVIATLDFGQSPNQVASVGSEEKKHVLYSQSSAVCKRNNKFVKGSGFHQRLFKEGSKPF